MFAAASGTEATFRDANAAVTEAVGAIRAIHVRRRGGGGYWGWVLFLRRSELSLGRVLMGRGGGWWGRRGDEASERGRREPGPLLRALNTRKHTPTHNYTLNTHPQHTQSTHNATTPTGLQPAGPRHGRVRRPAGARRRDERPGVAGRRRGARLRGEFAAPHSAPLALLCAPPQRQQQQHDLRHSHPTAAQKTHNLTHILINIQPT